MNELAPEPTDRSASAAPLAEAERAFARGDFGALRAALRALPEGLDAAARERVAELRRAVEIDPVHLAILVLSALAIVVIALRW